MVLLLRPVYLYMAFAQLTYGGPRDVGACLRVQSSKTLSPGISRLGPRRADQVQRDAGLAHLLQLAQT